MGRGNRRGCNCHCASPSVSESAPTGSVGTFIPIGSLCSPVADPPWRMSHRGVPTYYTLSLSASSGSVFKMFNGDFDMQFSGCSPVILNTCNNLISFSQSVGSDVGYGLGIRAAVATDITPNLCGPLDTDDYNCFGALGIFNDGITYAALFQMSILSSLAIPGDMVAIMAFGMVGVVGAPTCSLNPFSYFKEISNFDCFASYELDMVPDFWVGGCPPEPCASYAISQLPATITVTPSGSAWIIQ